MRKLDVENSPGTLIFLASKAMERLAEIEMKKRLGLTSSQWKVIMALSLSEGLSQKELAEKVYVDGSTLVPVIDKMEQNSLVERRPDPKDRRNNRIFLTKKSEATVDSITDVALELRKIIYKGLSQEKLESVNAVLRTIINNSSKAIADSK